METKGYDVIVVGAGNAAVGAALAASEAGASVLLIEKAPRFRRGGNSQYTSGYAFAYGDLEGFRALFPDLLTDEEAGRLAVMPYTVDDLHGDMMSLSQGRADPELSRVMAEESYSVIKWLASHGVKYKMNYHMAHEQDDGKLLFNPRQTRPGSPSDGIKGILDLFFDIFDRRPGMEVQYETKAVKLLQEDGGKRVRGVRVEDVHGTRDIRSEGGVILACGGFEANPEMRAKYLGPNWDLVKVRGTRYNTGDGLQMGLEIGAAVGGHMSGCHANPVFLRGPDVEMEDAGFAHDYPDGILVNLSGKRFVDEAPDYRRSSYAMVGERVLAQPRAMAFQIFDDKVCHRLSERYRPEFGERASTLEELAEKLGIDRRGFMATIQQYNAAVTDVKFQPGVLDGKRTEGIDPPKSNWAQKIDTPPFLGYPVTVGITFTYGGLKIDRDARVLDNEGRVIPGLYATGEVAGTYFHNYLGGSGLLKGMVFGRLAGKHAAAEAHRRDSAGGTI